MAVLLARGEAEEAGGAVTLRVDKAIVAEALRRTRCVTTVHTQFADGGVERSTIVHLDDRVGLLDQVEEDGRHWLTFDHPDRLALWLAACLDPEERCDAGAALPPTSAAHEEQLDPLLEELARRAVTRTLAVQARSVPTRRRCSALWRRSRPTTACGSTRCGPPPTPHRRPTNCNALAATSSWRSRRLFCVQPRPDGCHRLPPRRRRRPMSGYRPARSSVLRPKPRVRFGVVAGPTLARISAGSASAFYEVC